MPMGVIYDAIEKSVGVAMEFDHALRAADRHPEEKRTLKYTIKGDPRTKKNSLIIAGTGAKCPRCGKRARQFVRQSKAHDDYAKAAAWQLRPKPEVPIDYPVNVRCLFYMKTRRKVDGLNLCATIDDLLVKNGILADDNSRIVASHDGTRVLYDKENPRVEIYIETAEE